MGVVWETEGGTTSTPSPTIAEPEEPSKGGRRRRRRARKQEVDAAPEPVAEAEAEPVEDWSIPTDWLGPQRAAALAAEEAPPEPEPAAAAAGPPAPAVAPAPPPEPAAAPVEPAPVEPAPVEPMSVEPMSVEPMSVEPMSVEPMSVEPMPVEPMSVEPMPVEPMSVEPMPVEPGAPTTPTRRPEAGSAPVVPAGGFEVDPSFTAEPLRADDRRSLGDVVGDAGTTIVGFVREQPRRVAIGAVVGVLVIGALVVMGMRSGGPIEPELQPADSPLGMASVKLPDGCEPAPVDEEEEVLVGAVECPLGGDASMAVIEMDFRQAQANRIEPRFLVDTVLAARRAGWPGASIDTFSDVAPPPGWDASSESADFTGRVTDPGGSVVQTAGRLLVADNQALVVVARSGDRTRVEGLVASVGDSAVPPAG